MLISIKKKMFAGIAAIQDTIADAVIDAVGIPKKETKVTKVKIVEGGEDVENFHAIFSQNRLIPFLFLLFLFYWFFIK